MFLRHRTIKNIFFSVGSLFILCTLSGCFLQKTRAAKAAQASEKIHEYQARCTDMPFPFDANVQNKNLVTDYGDKVHVFVAFSTKTLFNDLLDLYHQDMEQLGWKEVALFTHDPQQSVFVFEKPTKLCVITLQQHKRSCTVTYHITTRF